MTGRLSRDRGRYDRQRVAHLQPLKDAVGQIGLPLLRLRKITAIIAALDVQIEDGGDDPGVNALLLDPLRAALRRQGEDVPLAAALHAVDTFARADSIHQEQARAGLLPMAEETAEERLDELMQEGYQLLDTQQTTAACARWLEAWTLVRQLATPAMRTPSAFDQAHALVQLVFNWSQDLAMELSNAALGDPVYNAHRLRYAREFLAQFPDADTDMRINFTRAEGEALWRLGRQAEAEAVYAALVERLPEEAWAYIGWADQYWLETGHPPAYATAAAILQRALARPGLHDRRDVLERLRDLYAASGQPQEQAAIVAQLKSGAHVRATLQAPPPRTGAALLVPPSPKPGRNAPCWCGSGRKYKHCHLEADRHQT